MKLLLLPPQNLKSLLSFFFKILSLRQNLIKTGKKKEAVMISSREFTFAN